MALEILGQRLDKVFPRLRRDVEDKLVPLIIKQPKLARGVLIDLMAGAYLDGRETGYVVHGSYLGAPRSIPAQTYRAWKDEALTHGEFVARRFEQVLSAKENVTAQFLGHYASISGEQAAWKGQDTEAEALAKLSEVEFKEFTRAWAREEEREHSNLEGVVIPVDDLFTLPSGERCWGPRDWDSVPDPSEWINCGHALRFFRQVTRDQLDRTLRGIGTVYDPPRRSAIYQ